jgi:8-oxo-dGTP pyrophosphatase MutT (NUDIX family)
VIWIGEDREPDLSFEYEAILRSLYPEDFVDSVVANDESAAIFLGGPIKHEKHGDLIIRYVVGPERVGVMGLLSKTGRLKASDAGALRSWLTRLRKELDAGKEVYVSLNDKSEPLFMRALRDGNFQIHNMYSHEYPFGVWKTVRVTKEIQEAILHEGNLFKIPVSDEIQEIEREWIGGIADFGNKEASRAIRFVPGYEEYKNKIQDSLRREYGDQFTVYRVMPAEQLEQWKNVKPRLSDFSFTLSRHVAEQFRNLAAHKNRSNLIIISMQTKPESVLMRGSAAEAELVISGSQLSIPSIKIVSGLSEQEEFTDPTGRFWGNAGAGGLFYAKDTSRYLIAKRSSAVNEPNTWGTWGGKLDGDETPEEALAREIREETGYGGGYDLQWLYTYQDGGFRFDNYLIVVPQEFEPTHSWETSGHKWVEFGDWPKPLHFGLRALIPHIPYE